MTQSSNGPVLIFDSGIGGLTVLREVRVLMPDQVFLFISDDEGFPYGAWHETELRERILKLFTGFIARHRPLLVIIACNTASTLVLGDLRKAFQDTPFVGTVPAIKPAAERTSSGHVSVLATPGTVKRAYTHGLIDSFATSCHVRLVGSTHLAAMAEAHIRGEELDEESVLHEIGPCFVEEDGKRTDIVVLACTHYPFLANVFRRLSPWPVDWLDPAEAIARRVLSLLQKQKAGEGNATGAFGQDIALFTSGQADFSTRRLMSGFGLQSQVTLEGATEPDA